MAFLIFCAFSVYGAVITDNFDSDTPNLMWNNVSSIVNGTAKFINNRFELECNQTSEYLKLWNKNIFGVGDSGYVEITFRAIDNTSTNGHFYISVFDGLYDNQGLGCSAGVNCHCGVTYTEFASLGYREFVENGNGLGVIGNMDGETHTIKIVVTRASDYSYTTYDMYSDNALIVSRTQNTGDLAGCKTPALNFTIKLMEGAPATNPHAYYWVDDFTISVNISSGAIDEGCDTGADCDCGVCTAGRCDYIGSGGYCTDNECCLSGVCSNNKCGKAEFMDTLERAKDQFFGESQSTSNFISLFFMVGLPLLIIMGTRSLMGLMGGGVVFFALGMFFVLLGWLSAFIFIMAFIASLILMIIAIAIGSGID